MTKWVAFSFVLALFGGVGFPVAPQSGQVNPRMLISAKAGLVTRVEGKAALQAADGRTPKTVEPNLQMMDGDRLRTEINGRVESLGSP